MTTWTDAGGRDDDRDEGHGAVGRDAADRSADGLAADGRATGGRGADGRDADGRDAEQCDEGHESTGRDGEGRAAGGRDGEGRAAGGRDGEGRAAGGRDGEGPVAPVLECRPPPRGRHRVVVRPVRHGAMAAATDPEASVTLCRGHLEDVVAAAAAAVERAAPASVWLTGRATLDARFSAAAVEAALARLASAAGTADAVVFVCD